LMSLFSSSLRRYIEELHQNNVRFRVIGNYALAGKKIVTEIKRAEALTAKNTGMTLNVAFYYSGHWDIVNACQRLAEQIATQSLQPAEITVELLQRELSLADLPPPDLFIRTSGEQRISNFLLWQLAYTELYFTELYWPDFTESELEKALQFYGRCERRFGMTSEQLVAS